VRPNLLYGILPTGALAASLLRLLTRRPNVTRLFGTHLAPVHGVAHLAHAWEVAAFKAPAAALVVTDDGTLGDRVARRLRVPAERFHFLMNGVDETFADGGGPTRAEARASLALDDAVAVFVFAHHLIPQHHPAVFVEAVERVDGAVGLVAGDGPERPALEALAGDRVRLLGNVSRTEIRRLLAAADAVVSLDELSNVVNSVLEALALGVPVVATATGGTRALLADGESALLLERPDVATVADALRRVASDPDLRARLSAGARLVAAERLVTWDERMRIEDDLLRGIAC
jgi:glycosyltransferase involved in cell wall biosynthesis